ncbi:hypothetical protein RHEC894_CH03698 [Rhizobium sp. CIAT894]|nr:hypothetical protein RHEC894_CH03698 [Rhizobium sp. CIAT894]
MNLVPMAEVHRPFFFSLKLGRLRAPSCSCRPFSLLYSLAGSPLSKPDAMRYP